METPAAKDLVRVWELGQDRPPWFRALLMLAPALPGVTFQDLSAMTIGRRNIHIFHLRRRLFGDTLAAMVQCPRCEQLSEFAAGVADLCPHEAVSQIAGQAELFSVEVEGRLARFRCPNSDDLAALGVAVEPVILDPPLIGRCIDTTAGEVEHSPALIEAVTDACYDCDPQVELHLDLDCAECGHGWSAPFDCVGFLWTEVANLARSLLRDVHVLAAAYGWREADILAMSGARRGFYLDSVAS
jgi:hypothetical protein